MDLAFCLSNLFLLPSPRGLSLLPSFLYPQLGAALLSIHSQKCTFTECYHVPGTVLGAKDTKAARTWLLALKGFMVPRGERLK